MPLNVLIVIDGGFTFDLPSLVADFTLTTLTATLSGAGINLTKANRGPDTSATHQNFTFDGAGVNLLDYDVIWLIGDAGRNDPMQSSGSTDSQPLPDSELAAIARYMDAGGGLFAVGDHDSLGSVMAGQLPRVRAMRSWYGANDAYARCGHDDLPGATGTNWVGQGAVPNNFPQVTVGAQGRADTVQTSPLSTYPNFGPTPYVWFENQSDSKPQPITPSTTPAHPILRANGHDVIIYPDHMHEGNTLGVIGSFDYTKTVGFTGTSFTEFPVINGLREQPSVVAKGKSIAQASRYAFGMNAAVDPNAAGTSDVNTLSVYDGRNAGVGRIVTGSTFHHYIDINLNGASDVTGTAVPLAGTDAQLHHGLHDAPANLGDITSVYINITQWLARPKPILQLILERSTFSQDEATASAIFNPAILVTVDGLKPDQFPGGGITSLSQAAFQPAWAPGIVASNPAGIVIEPVSVDSDDPTLPPRLQRFTFTYRVRFTDVTAAFAFAGTVEPLPVTATLTSPSLSTPLSDSADIELVKSANPFMLDLDNGNTTTWLSSDVRVFPVVAGDSKLGATLPANASRADALTFLQTMLSSLGITDFVNLYNDEEQSALSPFSTTTSLPAKAVYNFALARVRLAKHLAPADDVRVFFRIVPAPTTAALTYQEVAGAPVGSYRETPGASSIALPGVDNTGTQWLSFPCFAALRMLPPDTQTDPDNVKTIPANAGGEISYFYGALIDNNLDDAYLPPSPASAAASVSLPTLLMGEHQCLVAQVEYAGAPIPNGANPATSDKLSQRNLAFSPIANPGLDASRVALHTFEIEATPYSGSVPRPDELLLEWVHEPPARTAVNLFVPTWTAQDIVDLADRLYARHDVTVVDAHTVSVPGGGTRYIPIPRSDPRQTGVITVQFPLGVVKGQRFDLAVRQITSRSRAIENEVPKVERISQEEAAALIKRLGGDQTPEDKSSKTSPKALPKAPKGVFDLGHNKTLITDLSVLDGYGDHALIIEHIPPARLAAARQAAGAWRETIGAFQLAAPVSTKADMLPHHLRLLSVFRWRAEHLPQGGRWNDAFLRYVALIADKVRALGGDPYAVPATPNGTWPGLWGGSGAGSSPVGHHPPHGGVDTTVTAGKVGSLHYDHFGDFGGFTLQTELGGHRRFFSHEPRIERLAREAWMERYWVTVRAAEADPERVRELIFGRSS